VQKTVRTDLHPDLIITREAAIDRMGFTAAQSADAQKPYFDKQIQLIRRQARGLCPVYRNCREEDWCWHCASGQHGPLFRGDICLGCKLLTSDALIQIKSKLAIVPYFDKDSTDSIT
jgi:hypothetical protein